MGPSQNRNVAKYIAIDSSDFFICFEDGLGFEGITKTQLKRSRNHVWFTLLCIIVNR